jgi:hypothetical protein
MGRLQAGEDFQYDFTGAARLKALNRTRDTAARADRKQRARRARGQPIAPPGGQLQSLILADTASGARRSVHADALFVLIGAQPRCAMAATTSHATGEDSSSPATRCPPAARRCRCRWRPACPGCSPPATSVADRSTGSPPQAATEQSRSPWYTVTWPGHQPGAGR